MTQTKALVVLSGGQDSVTCLGWALAKFDHVRCVTFDYGQRHSIEVEAAMRVVAYFDRCYERHIPHEVVELGAGILQGTSPLTDDKMELETYENHDQMAAVIGDRVEKTFVPMRNSLFLTLAANRAVVHGIDIVVVGVCQEDNANYPDCTEKFIDCFMTSVNTSLGKSCNPKDGDSPLGCSAPLMHLSKPDTVRLALDTPYTYAALAFSHTAYDGRYPPVGKDHASVLRAHGFEQADRPDPLVLRAVHAGLMPLPDTPNYAKASEFIEAMKGDWS